MSINHSSFLEEIKKIQDECELREKLDLNCADCTAYLEADGCILSEVYILLTEKKRPTRKIVPIKCPVCSGTKGIKNENGFVKCQVCGEVI